MRRLAVGFSPLGITHRRASPAPTTCHNNNGATLGHRWHPQVILGDRRTLPLLRGCWELVADDAEATNSLIQARTHWQSACQVEFLLDWLEALVETGDDSTFGAVAAGLYTIAQRGGPVEDAERVFPVWSTDGEHSIYLAEWSIEEFGRRIEPRLRDITQRERDPKIIPLVMQQWGA